MVADRLRPWLYPPGPYELIDLANAAGMSIFGIRITYDTDKID